MARFALLLLAFVAFKTSDALRCWSCSSDVTPCADYFNTTLYSFYYGNSPGKPELQDCSQSQVSHYHTGQKAVCMKKKMVTTYNDNERITYIRQCAFVDQNMPLGKCPPETTNSRTKIEFCEYCDETGCNGASSVQISFIASLALPIFTLFFFLRK